MVDPHRFHVAPLTVGPKNAEAVCGVPWRWLRDHAAELGVPVCRVDGKQVIPAAPLLAALERQATTPAAPVTLDEEPEASPVDDLEAMRTRLGKRRRVGT